MQLKRIKNPDDDLTGKDLDQAIREIREVSQRDYWGERCKDFNAECVACHAWKHFDETGEVVE